MKRQSDLAKYTKYLSAVKSILYEMAGASDMDDFQPLKKIPRKAVLPAEHFKSPTSCEDMARICKGFV